MKAVDPKVMEEALKKVHGLAAGENLASLHFKRLGVERDLISTHIKWSWVLVVDLRSNRYDVFTHNEYDKRLNACCKSKTKGMTLKRVI